MGQRSELEQTGMVTCPPDAHDWKLVKTVILYESGGEEFPAGITTGTYRCTICQETDTRSELKTAA